MVAVAFVVACLLGAVVGRTIINAWRARERIWTGIAFLALAGPIMFLDKAEALVTTFLIAAFVTALVMWFASGRLITQDQLVHESESSEH